MSDTSKSGLAPQFKAMLAIQLVGGLGVLGSYAWGLGSHVDSGAALWGGVPEAIRPAYTGNMLLATAGWFLFSGYFLRNVDPTQARVWGGRFGFGFVNLCYAGILFFSTLWMPMTFAAIDSGNAAWELWIQVVLAATGLFSLLMVGNVISVQPRRPGRLRGFAIAGIVAFTVQTLLLDALIWPRYFSV